MSMKRRARSAHHVGNHRGPSPLSRIPRGALALRARCTHLWKPPAGPLGAPTTTTLLSQGHPLTGAPDTGGRGVSGVPSGLTTGRSGQRQTPVPVLCLGPHQAPLTGRGGLPSFPGLNADSALRTGWPLRAGGDVVCGHPGWRTRGVLWGQPAPAALHRPRDDPVRGARPAPLQPRDQQLWEEEERSPSQGGCPWPLLCGPVQRSRGVSPLVSPPPRGSHTVPTAFSAFVRSGRIFRL